MHPCSGAETEPGIAFGFLPELGHALPKEYHCKRTSQPKVASERGRLQRMPYGSLICELLTNSPTMRSAARLKHMKRHESLQMREAMGKV